MPAPLSLARRNSAWPASTPSVFRPSARGLHAMARQGFGEIGAGKAVARCSASFCGSTWTIDTLPASLSKGNASKAARAASRWPFQPMTISPRSRRVRTLVGQHQNRAAGAHHDALDAIEFDAGCLIGIGGADDDEIGGAAAGDQFIGNQRALRFGDRDIVGDAVGFHCRGEGAPHLLAVILEIGAMALEDLRHRFEPDRGIELHRGDHVEARDMRLERLRQCVWRW